MRCIPVNKCISWVDSKSIQLSCKYAEAFLKVQITCFYISHLPPTQPSCSWLTLLGNLVDDDLMTYGHTPPSPRLLQPACTQLRWQGPRAPLTGCIWQSGLFPPLLPFPSSRHSEEIFSSSHTAPCTPPTGAQKQWHGPEKNQHQSEHDSLLWDKIMQLAIWSLLHILPSPQKHLVAFAKPTDVQQALFFFFWWNEQETQYGTGPHCVWRQEAVRGLGAWSHTAGWHCPTWSTDFCLIARFKTSSALTGVDSCKFLNRHFPFLMSKDN